MWPIPGDRGIVDETIVDDRLKMNTRDDQRMAAKADAFFRSWSKGMRRPTANVDAAEIKDDSSTSKLKLDEGVDRFEERMAAKADAFVRSWSKRMRRPSKLKVDEGVDRFE